MRDVVIASAVRTPIGKFGGALADVPAVELGAVVVKEAIIRAHLAPEDVDEVIMGHVIQAGCGFNTTRQAALKAGVPVSVPAFTVNKVCASGMKSITMAALSIASGESEVIVAGGMENMSAAPYFLPNGRWGQRLGNGEVLDAILSDGLTDPGSQCHMGITAENLAEEFNIGRREQDEFAAESQRKAGIAMSEGRFDAEIVPVSVAQRKGDPKIVALDEYPRPDTTADILSKLKPAFKKDGTVTAGNASGINDAAAAVTLLSAEESLVRGIKPLARIVSYASFALDPLRMGMGPVGATQCALERAGLSLDDIDVIELNEAFAAQSLAVIRELKLDPVRVNLNGGAIALGHPLGASGTRIVVTLLHAMAVRDLRLGLATLCIGGGQGMAIIVERTPS